MAFILLLQTIYVKPWLSFFIAFAGVLLTSLLMYIVGRFGGNTICKKILGEKDLSKEADDALGEYIAISPPSSLRK